MFEKNMKISYLLDFYAELLDERTRNIMRAYYNDDLSLAEIAECEGISRQGVRHFIKRGEEQLSNFESCLNIAKRNAEIEKYSSDLEEIIIALEELNTPREYIDMLKDINENLLKGN